VVLSLVLMMAVIVLLSTVELGWIIVKDIITPPYVLPGITELLDIFGFFLLILIGIELLETIRAYLAEHVIHVEVVLEVALIAVARKVIILDVKDYPSLTILAIGALILALSVAFFVERRARSLPHGSRPWPPK
ncbi:MAG TPA: phosphate-starvation-inducible PsiE family protein, partial [Anaerolineae bacterium]|nr:phosphate-starvation-inducible PsiE family protein [Anaerolineae bacterium]